MTPATEGPRARFREQTRAEIKDIALRQLTEGGTQAIALTRIAKELGMSGPALYRYFASRDDLVSALIRDAYDDAATAIEQAVASVPGRAPRERLRALAAAYRGWAVANPHRYLLIEGTPLPGYTAPADTVARARAVLGPFLSVFASAEPSPAVLPVVRQMEEWAGRDSSVAEWAAGYGGPDPVPGTAGRALAGAVFAWSWMHGAVSLEVATHFDGMGHSPATLFDATIEALADAFRLA